MGFSNPRTPWSELARRLEGKEGREGKEDAPAGSNARPVDKHADGSDAPAFSRPDRYPVSVGPRGLDSVSRYAMPARTPSSPAGPLLRMSPPRPWAELHVHSQFSFLDGASDPEDLVAAGAAAGLSAMALTDHNGLYGAVRFAHAAAEADLPRSSAPNSPSG